MIRGRVSAVIAVVVVLGPASGIDVVDVARIDRRPVNVRSVGSIRPVADTRSIVDAGTITNAADPPSNAADPTCNATDATNAAGASGSIRTIRNSRTISRKLRRPIAGARPVADTAADPRPVADSRSIGRQLRWSIAARNAGSIAAGLRSDPTGRRACAGTRAGSIGR